MASVLEQDPNTSCGSSRAVEERIGGTATSAHSWLALEVPKPWGRKALPESDLPEAVKSHLSSAADELDGGRVLFITRDDRKSPEQFRLYLARSQEQDSTLWRLEFDSYEQLLELDFAAVMSGQARAGTEVVDQPIFLFCTNGKRDPCCARLGLAAYRTLADEHPEQVWQSSHQGGHRFAGNLIVLPQGVQYGRVEGTNASDIFHAHKQGEIMLPFYRGRTLYAAPVKAAEDYLRREHDLRGIDELRLLRSEEGAAGSFIVRFEIRSRSETWELTVQEQTSDYTVFKTTGDEQEAQVTLHRVQRVVAV